VTYTPTNWVDGSTPLNRANMMKIENELALLDGPAGSSFPIPLSTTLPASPVDGQEVILTNSLTAPAYLWLMRYVAASTYPNKWIYVGGTRFENYDSSSVGMVGNWASYLPGIALPFSGVYNFYAQALVQRTAGAALVGLSGWHDGTYDGDWQQIADGPIGYVGLSCQGVAKNLTAQTLTLGMYTSAAANAIVRYIAATPVRL
jgi:hypothetical protein